MLIAACDAARYEALGEPDHASCADNLRSALDERGIDVPVVPQLGAGADLDGSARRTLWPVRLADGRAHDAFDGAMLRAAVTIENAARWRETRAAA